MKLSKVRAAKAAAQSLPSRERGLKCCIVGSGTCPDPVAPLAGAWIEIDERKRVDDVIDVAPLAGAWIEIVEKVDFISQ